MSLHTRTLHILYTKALKPVLFRFTEPEWAHDAFATLGNMLGRFTLAKAATRLLFNYEHPALRQEVLGITFPNPIGLSAGFDKDARMINVMQDVGFGFTEIGTITDKPYCGNKPPRMHRLPNTQSIVVNYGLKGIGTAGVIKNIQRANVKNFIHGISIGKTNSPDTVPVDAGVCDYIECSRKVIESGVGNFYVINISCPNAFDGEPFTTPNKLDMLLKAFFALNPQKPVLIKMPINLEWDDFKQLLDIIRCHNVHGVTIGNLNKNKSCVSKHDSIPEGMPGALSGKPTWELSNNLISQTYKEYGDNLVIIGVGGIFSAEDAYEKIKRGATLVQLVTGMIFEGPQIVGDINRGLVKLLKKDGFASISDAIGVHHNRPKT